jgi:hypothetical protein
MRIEARHANMSYAAAWWLRGMSPTANCPIWRNRRRKSGDQTRRFGEQRHKYHQRENTGLHKYGRNQRLAAYSPLAKALLRVTFYQTTLQ